ncbi:isoprenyl transferase [Clostridia bacterium]|nr:isoprenyl transferase [Clostridia bacterium]
MADFSAKERPAVPQHVAVIMDGNGRWAEQRGIPKYKGHEAGMDAMIEIVRHASNIGVKHLTVYAFSTENWKRSMEEVSGIFQLLILYVNRELEELHRNKVRVDVLGDWTPFSKQVTSALNRTIDLTKNNAGLRFHIALNYGARAEILMAAKKLAGTERYQDIDEAGFAKLLYMGDMPDPDLLIRPGGEQRISNFLLWQTAYSELVFSDVLWPDYTPQEFDKAIEAFAARGRRFGGR